MPATGLPSVEQKVSVDSRDAVKGYDEIRLAALAYAQDNRKAIDAAREYVVAAKEMNRVNVELRDQFIPIGRAFGDQADRLGDLSESVRDHIELVKEQVHGYANLENAARDQAAMIRELNKAHDETHVMISRSTSAVDDYARRLKSVRMEAEAAATGIQNVQKATGDFLARSLAGRGDSGSAMAAIAAATGGGEGGGGGTAASLAAAMGGGGGGGGGRAPSFVPWRGGGWQAVRFWGMMATEVAATVVPALTAAGAAALVGVQSIEAMIPRYKAIFTTSEALGSAFGMTTGKFLGGGTALQQAQDAYQGAGYVMAGNLLSIIQGGGGQGFIDMGKTTLGMLSRGTSQMALNFTQGGIGKKLSDALSGGPEYLRQFGDIGANLGNLLLNVAPNLPGVGENLLHILSGGTGVLARGAGAIPGPIIGELLSYEAASRWGPALAGGEGLIGRMLGLRGAGGLVGLLGKAGGALAERAPVGGLLEGLGFGLSGTAGLLEMLAGGPAMGLYGATAYLMAKGLTAKNLPEQRMSWLQDAVTQGGFTGAWQPLAHAITTASNFAALAGAYAGKPGALGIAPDIAADPRAAARLGIIRSHDAAIYGSAAQGFAQQMGELVNSAPQLKAALGKAGLKSVGLADAFQIAQNALLDVTHAFGKDGKLTQVAQQAITAYARVIGPMTQSGGAFGAAVGAQTIMSQGAMQNLAKVNQAMDSYQQIIAAGPLGASALTAGARAAPAGAIAKGLTGYSTAANAAAWQAFASTSASAPGFITQMQQFGDQMRTYMTLGTATFRQTQGFSAAELQRILPQARQSPAALAMLMQQGAAMGVTGYYDTSKSLAQNYKDAASAIHSMAFNSTQFKKNMDAVTIATANVPKIAAQFADATAATVQSQRVAKVAQDAINVGKGINVRINAADIVSQLRAAGVQGASALRSSLDTILAQANVGKAARLKIEAQVLGADKIKTLQAMVDALHSKNVNVAVFANAHPVQTLQAALSGLTNKTVTVTTRIVRDYINIVHTQLGVPTSVAAGVSPGFLLSHGQTGGIVPGSGSGDITPMMLEPGEAIVPRYLVPLVAPILAAHRVPGFGGPRGSTTHMAAGGVIPPVRVNDIFPWHRFPESGIHGQVGKLAYTLIDEITKALKGADAKKIATALINKITQEVQYAKDVSSQLKQGLNLGGMDLTQGGVQGQMQNYLTSLTAFGGDIKTLRKQHLNKDVLAQLIAAGPVQGDALAQSILAGPGGVKGVNQLWAQIGRQSNAIGAQAAMAQFGGFLAPNLRSGTFSTNNVTINISGGGSGGLNLSNADIAKLVAKIQAALLKQAKRNNKTGIMLPGKGA